MSLRNIQMILTTIIYEYFLIYNIFVQNVVRVLELADLVLNTEFFLFLHHRTFELMMMKHIVALEKKNTL